MAAAEAWCDLHDGAQAAYPVYAARLFPWTSMNQIRCARQSVKNTSTRALTAKSLTSTPSAITSSTPEGVYATIGDAHPPITVVCVGIQPNSMPNASSTGVLVPVSCGLIGVHRILGVKANCDHVGAARWIDESAVKSCMFSPVRALSQKRGSYEQLCQLSPDEPR
jgi:hypothetical protein